MLEMISTESCTFAPFCYHLLSQLLFLKYFYHNVHRQIYTKKYIVFYIYIGNNFCLYIIQIIRYVKNISIPSLEIFSLSARSVLLLIWAVKHKYVYQHRHFKV